MRDVEFSGSCESEVVAHDPVDFVAHGLDGDCFGISKVDYSDGKGGSTWLPL